MSLSDSRVRKAPISLHPVAKLSYVSFGGHSIVLKNLIIFSGIFGLWTRRCFLDCCKRGP